MLLFSLTNFLAHSLSPDIINYVQWLILLQIYNQFWFIDRASAINKLMPSILWHFLGLNKWLRLQTNSKCHWLWIFPLQQQQQLLFRQLVLPPHFYFTYFPIMMLWDTFQFSLVWFPRCESGTGQTRIYLAFFCIYIYSHICTRIR